MKTLKEMVEDPQNKNAYKTFIGKMENKGCSVHLTWSGSICLYRKGKKACLKNLVCAIHSKDYIDFGPNENLKYILEPIIIELMSNIN